MFVVFFAGESVWASPSVIHKGPRPRKHVRAVGEKTQKSPVPAGEKKKKSSQKKASKGPEKAGPEYDPAGKVDPFVPFFVKDEKRVSPGMKKVSTEPGKLPPLPPPPPGRILPEVEISELRLTAVIKGKNTAFAMVQGPEGKGYVLQEGEHVGKKGGLIESIVFKEEMTSLGLKVIRKVVVRIPVRRKKDGSVEYERVEIKMGSES